MTDGNFRNGSATFGCGFLPAVYQGTYLRTSGAAIQNLSRPPQVDAQRQRMLLDRIHGWNQRHSDLRPGDSRLDARIANFELAFRMQTAAPELMDISQESAATRALYGIDVEHASTFGRMCLLARRMVERGVATCTWWTTTGTGTASASKTTGDRPTRWISPSRGSWPI